MLCVDFMGLHKYVPSREHLLGRSTRMRPSPAKNATGHIISQLWCPNRMRGRFLPVVVNLTCLLQYVIYPDVVDTD
jgi:hypothetical protein